MVTAVGPRPADFLVGRDEERLRLLAGLEDAGRGRGGLFLVTGEAGIGKTSLLEALAHAASSVQAPVFWGRCWESGGARPYWPWVQVVRSILGAADRALRDRLDPVLGRVGQLDFSIGGSAAPANPGSPQASIQARSDLFDAVALILEIAAGDHGGAVVALEDLHAADEGSMLLLQFVARRVSSSHLLIVGTYRDAEMAASPAHQRALARIVPHAEHLPLSGLDEQGVRVLLEQTTGDARPGFSARQIRATTSGNPLFVKEVAHLIATGREHAGPPPVADDVTVLVRRRLGRLGGRALRILTVAAVLGQDFESTAVVDLSEETAPAALDALGEAARAGVVTEVGLQRWSFSHAVLREALYDEMRPTDRMTLHRQAGERLERLHADDITPWLAAVAHHFFEAAPSGDRAKAVAYGAEAAERAMTALAYEEAAALCERALDVLREWNPGDDALRHSLLMMQARARMACGDARESQTACRRALKWARLTGSPERLAEAAYRLARIDWAEDLADILEEAKNALLENDSALRARILTALSYVRYWDRPWDWQALDDMAREGLAMARRVGDAEARRDVLEHHGFVFTDPRDVSERIAVTEELVRLNQELGSPWDLASARQARMRALFEAGHISAVAAELDTFTAEADKAHSSILRWAALRPRVSLLLLEGKTEEAEDLAQRMRALGERWESPDMEWTFSAQLAAIRRQQGRFDDLEELAREVTARLIGVPPRVHCCGVGVALALAEQGRADEARAALDEMVPEGLTPQNYGRPRTCCLMDLADVSWALWHAPSAAAVYDALLPYAGLHSWENQAFVASAGATDRALARVATVLGRWDEAETFFDRARQLHEGLGASVFLAHGDHDRGRMLLARRGPGDDARAVELLTAARDRYRALGMDFYRRRVDAVLGGLRTQHAYDGPGGLIRRDGDRWSVEFAGSVVQIRDGKGVRYLIRLLTQPDREVHALELVRGPAPTPPWEARGRDAEVERARQNTTRAIRATVERLGEMNAALGDHLRNRVRTGVHCSYVTDARAPVVWTVKDESDAVDV